MSALDNKNTRYNFPQSLRKRNSEDIYNLAPVRWTVNCAPLLPTPDLGSFDKGKSPSLFQPLSQPAMSSSLVIGNASSPSTVVTSIALLMSNAGIPSSSLPGADTLPVMLAKNLTMRYAGLYFLSRFAFGDRPLASKCRTHSEYGTTRASINSETMRAKIPWSRGRGWWRWWIAYGELRISTRAAAAVSIGTTGNF